MTITPETATSTEECHATEIREWLEPFGGKSERQKNLLAAAGKDVPPEERAIEKPLSSRRRVD